MIDLIYRPGRTNFSKWIGSRRAIGRERAAIQTFNLVTQGSRSSPARNPINIHDIYMHPKETRHVR